MTRCPHPAFLFSSFPPSLQQTHSCSSTPPRRRGREINLVLQVLIWWLSESLHLTSAQFCGPRAPHPDTRTLTSHPSLIPNSSSLPSAPPPFTSYQPATPPPPPDAPFHPSFIPNTKTTHLKSTSPRPVFSRIPPQIAGQRKTNPFLPAARVHTVSLTRVARPL